MSITTDAARYYGFWSAVAVIAGVWAVAVLGLLAYIATQVSK